MTRTQGLLVVSGVLIAVWLTGVRSGVRGGIAPAPQRVLVADPAVDAITGQADRLRAYLATPAPLGPSRRNPFEFHQDSPPSPSLRQRPGAQGRRLAERPARPQMQLIGVAEDSDTGVPVRTAIVSAMAQLYLVKEGERLLGRYQVVRVAAAAVELKDGESGEVFTLALR
jgi:hypothetical protein